MASPPPSKRFKRRFMIALFKSFENIGKTLPASLSGAWLTIKPGWTKILILGARIIPSFLTSTTNRRLLLTKSRTFRRANNHEKRLVRFLRPLLASRLLLERGFLFGRSGRQCL